MNGGTRDRHGVSADVVRALAENVSAVEPDYGREIGAAVDACFATIAVQVSGRRGVGKSSVRAVLGAHPEFRSRDIDRDIDIAEAASLDVPRSPDPILDGDIVVHVLAGGVQQADLDAVASATTSVVVLAKADTIDDLDGVVQRLTSSIGAAVYPLMGTIASNAMRGRPATFDSLRPVADALSPEQLLTSERFLQAEVEMSQQTRLELLECIETFGVRAVVSALHADPAVDDAALRLLLTENCGVSAVVRAVGCAIDAVRVNRDARLLSRLAELAVAYPSVCPEVEEYLASDDAVVAAMRSALHFLGEPESEFPTLHTAAAWRDRWQSAPDAVHARAALAVARGYTRLRAGR